jgi:peptidoglycan/xylan/chitin deacetylase (PgdA/CDA1 family)
MTPKLELLLRDEESMTEPVITDAPNRELFWPDGARMAISVTMMFEADGGQSDAFQPGPEGTAQAQQRFPNFHNITGRAYGAKEGMPRLLDMLDRCKIKGSSFMIGQTIDRYPDLAREIVARGHEAGGRQAQHRPQFHMSKSDEREFLRSGFESYRRALGQWPKGYNAWGPAI